MRAFETGEKEGVTYAGKGKTHTKKGEMRR